jgi:hypothetical protein
MFLKMILKMNFNFKIKDMLGTVGPSIRSVTSVRDLHHTGKSGIKRGSRPLLDSLGHDLENNSVSVGTSLARGSVEVSLGIEDDVRKRERSARTRECVS